MKLNNHSMTSIILVLNWCEPA